MKVELAGELAQYSLALESYFSSVDDIALAILFGSQARGCARPLSDVDVALLLDGRPADARLFDARLEVMGALMSILHTAEVDVVMLNQAPPALRFRVVRDGILLYCRERHMLIEFVSRTVVDYLDFKPVLLRHEQAILERARKGELQSGYNPYRGTLEHYRQLRERLKGAAKPEL